MKSIVRSIVMQAMLLSLLYVTACQTKAQKGTESNNKVVTTDIFAAAFMGDLKAIEYHINEGTDLNQKDQFGSTPLIIATTFNKVDAAKALIKAGADVNATNTDGSTALHTASFLCRNNIVQLLLENAADKTVVNKYGSTALQSVESPFTDVKPIYEQLNATMGPLGLKLDYDELEKQRPVVAKMLK